jgi:uncharacterized damage-inducible protein DinB
MLSICDPVRSDMEYNVWATSRLLNAATALSHEELHRHFGTADGSVHGTLLHLYRSERLWLQRLRFGTPQVPWKLPEDEDWTRIVEEWPQVQQGWLQYVQALKPEDLEDVKRYADLKGVARAEPLWQILLHVVNHSTHHRGQVSGFLRALGKTPPPLDEIAFFRERQKASS